MEVFTVRIDGFKLEGGVNCLKRVFANFSNKNEIISRNNRFRNSVRQNSKQKLQYQKKQSVVSQKQSVVSQKQSVVSQKQSVVYTSKQQNKTEFKELEIERLYTIVYTGSLQTQSYIQSSQNPKEIH